MQKNPFDIPSMGFNQENPLFTSMNMMREMWENMGSNSMGMSTPISAIPSAEELDKRIKELRTVENWLRLNLSMLTSTIQGLEIQYSTLSTLQSFAQGGLASMPGLTEAMSAATMQTMGQSVPAGQSEASSTSTDQAAETEKPKQSEADSAQQSTTEDSSEHLLQAGQAWWNLMQEQFDALAQATTQSMQQAQATSSDFSASVGNPSADTTFSKSAAAKKTTKKSAKSASAPTKTAKKASKVAKKSAKKVAKTTKSAKKASSATK